MADSGTKNSPAVKPVLPPKPIGTVLTTSKIGLKRISDQRARVSFEGQNCSSQDKVTNLKNVKSVSDRKDDITVVSPEGSKKVPKPPLLPKPDLVNILNKRVGNLNKNESASEPSHPSFNNASSNQKPPKLFIPLHQIEDQTKDIVTCEEGKAPVAKLDEFDHVGDNVSPVRPPRSPKHKSFGGMFVPELVHKQQLFGKYQGDIFMKSRSLGRNVVVPLEVAKTNSLGSNQVRSISQVLENSCSNPISENVFPVRPPRRRNKSITQSPEVVSPLPSDLGFVFEETKSSIPEYAQVNYSLKRNRRPNESIITSHSSEGNGVLDSKSDICEDRSDLSKVNENPTVACKNTEKFEQIKSQVKEMSISDHSSISFTSNKVIDNFTGDLEVNREDYVSCINEVNSSFENCQPSTSIIREEVCTNQNQICNDICADCLPAQILEESCDDSVSSSKLDWQSVCSSFHSDSNVALESENVPSGSGCGTQEQILVVNEVKIDLEANAYSEQKRVSVNSEMSIENRRCSIHHELSCKCGSDSSNVSGISALSDLKVESPISERRRHYKRLTSSLPTRKVQKKQVKGPRRLSWTGYKDSIHFNDNKSSWLDEEDSSSAIMGDLDSSDNAVKQSSTEEVELKTKPDQSISRRFNTWLSSFGKSGKRNRSNRRHSHFYCERQVSDTSDISEKDNFGITVVHTPVENSNSCAQVSSHLSVPSAQLNYDFSDNVVSEESIITDIQSDSDGEGDECSYDERSLSHDEVSLDGKKAFYIANELMTSEQAFIKALKLLNVEFKQFIQKASSHGNPVIPPSELDKILNSLPQLQQLNEHLLSDLEDRIQNWSSLKKIADVIVKKGAFLKLYTTYIQNFEAQCNFFDECCQKYPKFARAVKEFEAFPICQKLSVKHYMLKPIQRIPQYRLLLDDYARHQHPSSPDYKDTETALKIVCEVAEHANRSIKLGDHLSVLLKLQSQLGNYEIIKPGRVLLKDGELYKLSRKERQPRFFILLNDCLLYTSYYGSGPSSGLKVNSELSLGGMKVTVPQAEDYHNEFSIISSTRSFTLSARSSSERQQWVDALQNAIQEYTSRQLTFQAQKFNVSRPDGSSEPFKLGKQAPIWIQDGRVTKCQSCVAEFTVTFRRHHCRACGKVVCGVCSAYRAPLQYMKFHSERVCEDCFNTLLREFETPTNRIADLIKAELGLRKCDQSTLTSIRSQFKRLGPSSGKKSKKHIPQRLLEVTANDAGSEMCGWLQRRTKRSWKRLWFVLKEQVLYVYKASEDVVALETIPVLGYKVERMKQIHFELYEGIDAKLVFQLAHSNQQPLVFSADNENLVNRWISRLQEATVLK